MLKEVPKHILWLHCLHYSSRNKTPKGGSCTYVHVLFLPHCKNLCIFNVISGLHMHLLPPCSWRSDPVSESTSTQGWWTERFCFLGFSVSCFECCMENNSDMVRNRIAAVKYVYTWMCIYDRAAARGRQSPWWVQVDEWQFLIKQTNAFSSKARQDAGWPPQINGMVPWTPVLPCATQQGASGVSGSSHWDWDQELWELGGDKAAELVLAAEHPWGTLGCAACLMLSLGWAVAGYMNQRFPSLLHLTLLLSEKTLFGNKLLSSLRL